MKRISLAAAASLLIAGGAVAQTASAQDAPAADTTVQTPVGGYAPATSPFSAPPTPGAKIVFVPNPQTPTEAFPPPPPKDHYPICKKGQTDGCKQRGGR
ncbi:MAG: hypothetical protein ACOY45_04450 [Pseudomonadota bacterium]